ncbi:MAG: hypothetical protein ACTS5I_10910, partial [Rhodanobacter sp.]
ALPPWRVILPTMSLLRTLRYQQQRHGSFVRWGLMLVLLSVMGAGMPRWIVHVHTADHAFLSVVALDGHTLDIHDTDANNTAEPAPDSTHLHGHYLGTFSSLLPPMLTTVAAIELQAQCGRPEQVSSPCEGHLATLHRPPIV